MKIVDLSHTMSIHTPGWVGYAGNIVGAFPWRYEGLGACPCRILAIFDAGNAPVEALGDAVRGIFSH